jgi:DNA adenine methylase
MLSPLRYPGAKADFSRTAHEIICGSNLSGCSLIEPYCGSASVSLALLDSGAISHATLLEKDPLIYSFWRSLVEHTDELICRFQELPITLETWSKLRPLLAVKTPTDETVVDLGLAALFFNRANFSGILNAGPIGGMKQVSAYPINCRTNKDELIARMLTIAALADRIAVHFGDAVEFINNFDRRKRRAIFYVDPPYYVKGKLLYRHHYQLADHKALSRALASLSLPWLLSYDVHHVIEFLYEEFHVNRLAFRYSAHSPKNHEELLISNFPIAPELLSRGIVSGREIRLPPTTSEIRLR